MAKKSEKKKEQKLIYAVTELALPKNQDGDILVDHWCETFEEVVQKAKDATAEDIDHKPSVILKLVGVVRMPDSVEPIYETVRE